MQISSNPRFIKNFAIGLIASSVGAFVALPGTAMPKPDESPAATEVTEDTTVDAVVDELPVPSAAETLPSPVEALEADTETTVNDTVDTDADADAEADITDPTDAVDATTEADVDTTDAIDADADTVDATTETEVETTDDDEADVEMTDDTVVEDGTEAADDAAADDAAADDATADDAAADDVSEEINTKDFTIAELTNSSGSFTILAAALEAADLTEVLSEEGPYTVFAPTDEAFEALPVGAVEQLLLPENKDVLIQVLTYHVVPGAVLSTDLESGNVATLEGSDLAVKVGDTVTVNNANVLVADIQASNGVIHIIDRVIVPSEPEANAEVKAPALTQ